ncbi:hypothetical protein [Martelella endophytica]|uniref:hypothetical protein n=1 Tax=Martelella endophytica TaxID=1486262 RepID=UPI000AB09236|nr:hypothetical protein [Martelella endophytica]
MTSLPIHATPDHRTVVFKTVNNATVTVTFPQPVENPEYSARSVITRLGDSITRSELEAEQESALEEGLEDSFPASDPVSASITTVLPKGHNGES